MKEYKSEIHNFPQDLKKVYYYYLNIEVCLQVLNMPKHFTLKQFKMFFKPFIIAEIGLNHNGRLDIAQKCITQAAKAGVDAVKFQNLKQRFYKR